MDILGFLSVGLRKSEASSVLTNHLATTIFLPEQCCKQLKGGMFQAARTLT